MRIQIRLASLRELSWRAAILRFLFGGTITVITGLLGHRYGPTIAGLFLAFPAIFPAAVTLIAKEEIEDKAAAGFDGVHRGRVAGALDAYGTALGTLGLFTFALFGAHLLPVMHPALALFIAGVAWLGAAITAWVVAREI